MANWPIGFCENESRLQYTYSIRAFTHLRRNSLAPMALLLILKGTPVRKYDHPSAGMKITREQRSLLALMVRQTTYILPAEHIIQTASVQHRSNFGRVHEGG
jgi:hypothetical protein